MGDADSIDAHPLEDFHLSLDGTVIRHRAQSALVVVHTHAVELHPLAVEEEAVVDGKLRPTESKAALITVGNNAVHQNLCHQVVEVRVVHRPQGRFCRGKHLLHRLGFTGCYSNGLRFHRVNEDALVFIAHHGGPDGDRRFILRIVLHLGRHIHGDILAGGVFLLQVRRGDLRAIARYMHRFRDRQVDVTVNAAAGIPTAGRALHAIDPVFRPYRDYVLRLAVADYQVRDVIGERRIAVRMAGNQFPIHIGITVHIDTAEVDGNPLVRHLRREGKRLAVPSDTTCQVADLGSGCTIGKVKLDAPVVR